jgi:hypothetical protein
MWIQVSASERKIHDNDCCTEASQKHMPALFPYSHFVFTDLTCFRLSSSAMASVRSATRAAVHSRLTMSTADCGQRLSLQQLTVSQNICLPCFHTLTLCTQTSPAVCYESVQ